MAKNLFNRYIWLVDTIYRNGKLSFKEINDKWLQTDFSEGKPIPLRTFHNHREAIQDLFDILTLDMVLMTPFILYKIDF